MATAEGHEAQAPRASRGCRSASLPSVGVASDDVWAKASKDDRNRVT